MGTSELAIAVSSDLKRNGPSKVSACLFGIKQNLKSGDFPLARLILLKVLTVGLPRRCGGKESTCQLRRFKRCGFESWVRKIPWSRKWQPIPGFFPGKFCGQRSLAG